MTKLQYGLIGHPVRHSLSPAMQNAAFRTLGIEAEYVLYDIEPDRLEGFLGEMMVHKLSRAAGIVVGVTEAQAGWPPQIILKLTDGTLKKGRLSDFREPSGTERVKTPAAQ